MNEREWEDFKLLIDGHPSRYERIVCVNSGNVVVYIRRATNTPIAISQAPLHIELSDEFRPYRYIRDFLTRREVRIEWSNEGFFRAPLVGLTLSTAPVRSITNLPPRVKATKKSKNIFKANRTKLDEQESPVRSQREEVTLDDTWTVHPRQLYRQAFDLASSSRYDTNTLQALLGEEVEEE